MPSGNMGAACSVDADCAGAAVVCERDVCSCPWDTQMSGPDCETPTAASAWALAVRASITIGYLITFAYAACEMYALVPRMRALPALSSVRRTTIVSLGLAQAACLLEVVLNLWHIADIAGAVVDKQVIAIGFAIAETLSACCGMLVLLNVSLLWIAVCEQTQRMDASALRKGTMPTYPKLQRFAAAYALFFVLGCLACIIVMILVSVTAYYLIFYPLLALTATVVILTFQIGSYRLRKLLQYVRVSCASHVPRYSGVVKRTARTSRDVTISLVCCIVALGASYFAYWSESYRSLALAWIACILVFHLAASFALLVACSAIAHNATSAVASQSTQKHTYDADSARANSKIQRDSCGQGESPSDRNLGASYRSALESQKSSIILSEAAPQGDRLARRPSSASQGDRSLRRASSASPSNIARCSAGSLGANSRGSRGGSVSSGIRYLRALTRDPQLTEVTLAQTPLRERSEPRGGAAVSARPSKQGRPPSVMTAAAPAPSPPDKEATAGTLPPRESSGTDCITITLHASSTSPVPARQEDEKTRV